MFQEGAGKKNEEGAGANAEKGPEAPSPIPPGSRPALDPFRTGSAGQ
jgi:hypothetical protein